MNNTISSSFVGDPVSDGVRTALLTLGWLACVSGVFGNVLIITTLLSQKALRSVHNIYIANLAVADLMLSGYSMPIWLLDLYLGYHPVVNATHCVFNCYGTCGNFGASVLTLLAISVNRYVSVCHHRIFIKAFTNKRTILYCMMTWVMGYALCVPSHLEMDEGSTGYDPASHLCSFSGPRHQDERWNTILYSHLHTAVMLILPAIIVGWANGAILHHWRRSKKRLQKWRRRGEQSQLAKAEIVNSDVDKVEREKTEYCVNQDCKVNPFNPTTPFMQWRGRRCGPEWDEDKKDKIEVCLTEPASGDGCQDEGITGFLGNPDQTNCATQAENITCAQSHDRISRCLQIMATYDCGSEHTIKINSSNTTGALSRADEERISCATLPCDENVGQSEEVKVGSPDFVNPGHCVDVNDIDPTCLNTSSTKLNKSCCGAELDYVTDHVLTSAKSNNGKDRQKTKLETVKTGNSDRNCWDVGSYLAAVEDNGECTSCCADSVSEEISDLVTAKNDSKGCNDTTYMSNEYKSQTGTATHTLNHGNAALCAKHSHHTESWKGLMKPKHKCKHRHFHLSPSDISLIRSLLIVFVCCVLLYLPLSVVTILELFERQSADTMTVVIMFAFINHCINWIVYGLMNGNFRDGYKKQVPCCFKRRQCR